MKLKYRNRWIFLLILFTASATLLVSQSSGPVEVKAAGEKVYILDQTGERWEITQAVSLGFDPDYFEFGIGRNAFRPLDKNDWRPAGDDIHSQIRIIGVAGEGEAHAYSVAKLRYHETANTHLGSKPIVAGY